MSVWMLVTLWSQHPSLLCQNKVHLHVALVLHCLVLKSWVLIKHSIHKLWCPLHIATACGAFFDSKVVHKANSRLNTTYIE